MKTQTPNTTPEQAEAINQALRARGYRYPGIQTRSLTDGRAVIWLQIADERTGQSAGAYVDSVENIEKIIKGLRKQLKPASRRTTLAIKAELAD